jgi:hypothetical protein
MPVSNRSAIEQLTSWRILERARSEQRRIERRSVHIPARIDLGGSLQRECIVTDISGLGAMLAVHAPHELPDTFTLLLAPSGHPARECRVIWRSDDGCGVEFLNPDPDDPLVH